MIWVKHPGGAWFYKLGDNPDNSGSLRTRYETVGRIAPAGQVLVYPDTRRNIDTRIKLGQGLPDEAAKRLIEQWWTPAKLMKLKLTDTV